MEFGVGRVRQEIYEKSTPDSHNCWNPIGFVGRAGCAAICDRSQLLERYQRYLREGGVLPHRNIGSPDTMVLRPEGTLSGGFDAGKVSELTLAGLFNSAGEGAQSEYGIKAGDKVLVVLSRSERHGYVIPFDGAVYMPSGQLPVAVVRGFADRRVLDTLSQIQQIRKKPAMDSGTGEQYWQDHSVILAKYGFLDLDLRQHRQGAWKVIVFPIGTISGSFDTGRFSKLALEWDYSLRDEIPARRHMPGDIVMLVVRNAGGSDDFHSPEGWSAFMPGIHESMRIVKSDAVPKLSSPNEISATLAAVQKLRMPTSIPPPSKPR